jgi:hypothetical protein
VAGGQSAGLGFDLDARGVRVRVEVEDRVGFGGAPSAFGAAPAVFGEAPAVFGALPSPVGRRARLAGAGSLVGTGWAVAAGSTVAIAGLADGDVDAAAGAPGGAGAGSSAKTVRGFEAASTVAIAGLVDAGAGGGAADAAATGGAGTGDGAGAGATGGVGRGLSQAGAISVGSNRTWRKITAGRRSGGPIAASSSARAPELTLGTATRVGSGWERRRPRSRANLLAT